MRRTSKTGKAKQHASDKFREDQGDETSWMAVSNTNQNGTAHHNDDFDSDYKNRICRCHRPCNRRCSSTWATHMALRGS